MTIVRMHHAQIMIPRGAEEEARRFYCGLLGLPEIEKPAVLKARGGLWLQVGENQLHLGADDSATQKTRAHIAYQVRDLPAWRAKLVAAGVALSDGEQPAEFARFELRDPFGNRIELLELR